MQLPSFSSLRLSLIALGSLCLLSCQSSALPRPSRPLSFPLSRSSAPGVAIGWGLNTFGEATIPTTVQSNLVAVAAGGYHSLALLTDGSVVGWGLATYSQNIIPSGATNVVAIAEGNGHSMALRADGKVICWGDPSDGRSTVPAGASNVVAIAGGGGHSLALKIDGTVVAWGWNAYGQTIVPIGLSKVVAIAAGFAHSLALKEDGTVLAWGANQNGQSTVPIGLSNVVAIAGGGAADGTGNVSAALKADGTVALWGDSTKGQLTVPPGLHDIVSISCGYYNVVAADSSGRIWNWGSTADGLGFVPTNFQATKVAAGNYHALAFQIGHDLLPRLGVATPQVVNGFVVGLNLIDGGEGYTDVPVITIVGGSGTGATATANIENGSITGFTITNPGSGYTVAPTVKIAPPPFDDSLTVAISKIKITLSVLINATYLLESSEDLSHWTAVGSPFIAASSEIEQEFPVGDSKLFFRLTRQ